MTWRTTSDPQAEASAVHRRAYRISDGVAFGRGTYVTRSADGGVCTSPDGSTWTVSEPWSLGGMSVDEFVFAGGHFFAAGYSLKGNIFSSEDGTAWRLDMPIVGLFSGDVGIAAGLNYVLVFDRSGSTALGDLEHLFVGSFEFPK